MSPVPRKTMPPLLLGPITARQVEAFAQASGDTNPLHASTSVADSIGLAAPPVHGMLLVAFMHEAVRRHRPEAVISGFSTRFMAPVPVGEVIEISGREVKAEGRMEPVILRILVKTATGDLACMAEATLGPPPEGWS